MTAHPRAAGEKPSRRTTEIRLIHAMKRELAMADESYQAIVGRVTKGAHQSSADLDDAQREALIQELRRLGAGRKGGRARPGKRPHTGHAAEPQGQKIRALWLALWNLGAVEDPADSAIDAFVKRQTKLESLSWLDGASAFRVIEALKRWCRREGFDVPALGIEAKRALVLAQQAKLGEQPTPEADLLRMEPKRLDQLTAALGGLIRERKVTGPAP